MVYSTLLLLLLMAALSVVQASIHIVDTGREYRAYSSTTGVQLKEGVEYPARIQQLTGNTHLCYDHYNPEKQNWSVTVPEDGSPGRTVATTWSGVSTSIVKNVC